jgi:hypothetical protein
MNSDKYSSLEMDWRPRFQCSGAVNRAAMGPTYHNIEEQSFIDTRYSIYEELAEFVQP